MTVPDPWPSGRCSPRRQWRPLRCTRQGARTADGDRTTEPCPSSASRRLVGEVVKARLDRLGIEHIFFLHHDLLSYFHLNVGSSGTAVLVANNNIWLE